MLETEHLPALLDILLFGWHVLRGSHRAPAAYATWTIVNILKVRMWSKDVPNHCEAIGEDVGWEKTRDRTRGDITNNFIASNSATLKQSTSAGRGKYAFQS